MRHSISWNLELYLLEFIANVLLYLLKQCFYQRFIGLYPDFGTMGVCSPSTLLCTVTMYIMCQA